MPDVKFSNQYPYTDFHELNLDWVIETVKHWADLVGKTIQSITLTGTTGLVDTYTINYSDGTTSTFNVTNGRGITSIVLTGSLNLVDTYTITYNDGSTSTFQITNGNGISSIEKTGTSGLIDTYTITFTDGSSTTFEVKNGAEALDATLSLAGYAADAKAVGDALDLKQNAADPAGLADNLTPYSVDSGATQSVPFINQGTGCGNGESIVDTGSYSQGKEKLGNTVGVNQLVNPANYEADKTEDGVSFEKLADGRIKITVDSSPASAVRFRVTNVNVFTLGHKYLFSLQSNYGAGKLNVMVANATYSSIGVGADNLYDTIWQAVGDVTQWAFIVNVRAGCATGTYYVRPISVDLDRWYGSPDRIPSDLLSHPENWGRYYAGSLAYNAGTLVSADGSVLTSIGRNVWDEEAEQGDINSSGVPTSSSTYIRTKNYTRCIPNTSYYCRMPAGSYYNRIFYYDSSKTFLRMTYIQWNNSFTVPANAYFFKIVFNENYGTIYNHDITFDLYYPNEYGYDKYYRYIVLAQIDTGSEVLRSAGSIADEKTPGGTITRKVGIVDLGTLTWTYENGVFYSTGTSAIAKPQQYPTCARYTAIDNGSDKSIYIGNSGITYAYDSSYTNAAAFQAAMNGVEMTYELLTPTTEQGTPFSGASADNFAIDDFGSMYWTQTNGVPQGVEIFYPYDYKAAVDTLLNMVDGDVEKIVTTDTYPDVPTADGTYVLKAVVSGGSVTRSWVLE